MILSGLVNTIPPVMAGSSTYKPAGQKRAKKAEAGVEETPDQIVLAPAAAQPGSGEALMPGAGAAAPAPAAAVAAATTTPSAVPSFITPASLASVSGGTAVVTLLWQVSKILVGGAASTHWIPFVCALLVGGVIYWMSIGDKNVRMEMKDKVIGIFIAFVNSMVLFTAALGINGNG